jgi:hypothetical protein
MGHGISSRWRKDIYDLVFQFYSLQEQISHGQSVGLFPRLRPVNGRAVVRWKTKRKHEWEKRHGISRITAEESGEAADSEYRNDEE